MGGPNSEARKRWLSANERAFSTVAEWAGDDPVNAPAHYRSHPSGIECIQITEHMGFNLGNAVKYIWRADEKGNALEDLRKAAWYVQREIERREAGGLS